MFKNLRIMYANILTTFFSSIKYYKALSSCIYNWMQECSRYISNSKILYNHYENEKKVSLSLSLYLSIPLIFALILIHTINNPHTQ